MSDPTTDTPRARLEPLIFCVRGHRVILDADLAGLYGVTTKALNQAVKRNPDRFPEDFAFQVLASELADLRSQLQQRSGNSIENQGDAGDRSRFVTGSQKHRTFRPWVYTEHGALMAANMLRSATAIRMSIFVIRAFVRLREQSAANVAILTRLAEIDRTLLQHDSALRDLYRKLRSLLAPPADPPRRTIGFLSDL
jgi:ORF6N domain